LPTVPDHRSTRPPRRGRIPAVVVAATVAFGALGAFWSVVAPLGEAPDEPAHLALVWHLADGNPYPSYDGLRNQTAIIALCRTFAAATRACPREGEEVTSTSTRRHPVGDAPDKNTRPAWNDAGGDDPLGQLNQMPQHPPLYYQAMATVLRAERAIGGGPWSADRELALLRLVNVLLVMPLPLLAWWASRRFGLENPTASVAAVALLAFPMLAHIGSTLNNDNLLTLLAAVLAALLAGVVRGDRSVRTAAGIGVVLGLALLTKAFAFVFPPIVVLAYVVGTFGAAEADQEGGLHREDQHARETESLWARMRPMVAPLACAGAVTVALAAWWYLGVNFRTGSFAPTIETDRLNSSLQPPGFSPNPWEYLREFVPNLNTRFWGSFGWYSVRFPAPLSALCTAVMVVAVATAIVPRRGAANSTRLQRVSLLVPMSALGAFVLARSWGLYVVTSKFPFIQGRYLFAGLIGVVILAAIGAVRWSPRWALVGVLAAAVGLQGEAIRRSLLGWWGGPGLGPRGQLRAMIAWSGWPGEVAAAMGVALALSWVMLAVAVGRSVTRRPVESTAT